MEFTGDLGLHLKDDLLPQLFRIRIFSNELMELYNLFNSRVEEVNKRESKVFEDIGWPEPVMLMRNFGGRATDIQLNLYFKSFLFVSRQAVEKILRSVYLARETLEPETAPHKICDGSAPKRVKFAPVGRRDLARRSTPTQVVRRHMEIEHYFLIFFGINAVYIVIGNYVYFNKVLPHLKESHSGMPSTQFKQIEKYIDILDENNERPWFYHFLKFTKITAFIMFTFFAIFAVMIWGNR